MGTSNKAISAAKRGISGLMLYVAWAALPACAQAPPTYEVDPSWPKPLPNHWIIQNSMLCAAGVNDNRKGVYDETRRHGSW